MLTLPGTLRAIRALTAAAALQFVATALAQSPPPLVVETDPLLPAEQQQLFHLPPGFEIQLVASDPDIGQPMNMNFDSAGRLWVTSSVEYPYPVAGEGVEPREERWGKPEDRDPRDWVTVIEGIGDDGRPTTVRRFAEGLNIPIGIMPMKDGAIVYSIPNIEHFRDTDGDGVADQRTKLYSPFGNLDTHGMVNSFTRGLDGWIYACHGFRNTSKVQGTDGHIVEMNSGNTFRFRDDGSRIEHWTYGQVNPFGLCFDPWGNLYSADCHSRPLTGLLQGAYYQSFGKPHDGLGFGPDMIAHSHGSTGICGCAWYEAPQFPPDYTGCIFLCNPVTGRVHRDRIDWKGSSPWAVEQPEFLACDDGWFRPVDVKLGPDGALYIADFYNAIIGHYEVPLEHPRRDRTRGRIWRIVYRGNSEATTSHGPGVARARTAPASFDLTTLPLTELIDHLGDANFMVRCQATDEIVRRFSAHETYHALLEQPPVPVRDLQRAHIVWVLKRFGFPAFTRLRFASSGQLAVSITQWLRSISAEDFHSLPAEDFERLPAVQGISNDNPIHSGLVDLFVKYSEMPRSYITPEAPDELTLQERNAENGPQIARRAAVDALGRLLQDRRLPPLLPFPNFPVARHLHPDDTHLRHAVKLAVRNSIGHPESLELIREQAATAGDAWAEIAASVPNSDGVTVSLAMLPHVHQTPQRQATLRHIARYGEASQLDELLAHMADSEAGADWSTQLDDLHHIHQGIIERGGKDVARVRPWGVRLASRLLEEPVAEVLSWTPVAHGPNAQIESAFDLQTRPFHDKAPLQPLWSSFPKGEQRTGILRSDPFELLQNLSFYLAGHDGVPISPIRYRNFVQLRDARTQEVLRKAMPPRKDTAHRVEWDLQDLAGRRGYLELVDGNDGNAYAWLAAGRFSLAGLNPTSASPQVEACRLIADLKLEAFDDRLTAIITTSGQLPSSLRTAAAEAILKLHPSAVHSALLAAAQSPRLTPERREQCYARLGDRESGDAGELLAAVFRALPAEEQRQLALTLAGDPAGGLALLTTIESGAASPRLLQDAGLVERLQTLGIDRLQERIAEATRDLPTVDEAARTLLASRLEAFHKSTTSPDPARGAALFKQHCAACHQLGGLGEKIGPQLDGVGLRGPERLLEDILDPNRNVDAAFRTTLLVLHDGQVLTGLVRREEGEILVLADSKGKEFSVSLSQIETRKHSSLSLMPANLGEAIPNSDLQQLLRWLLASNASPQPQ